MAASRSVIYVLTKSIIEIYNNAGVLLDSIAIENYTSVAVWKETAVLGTKEGDIVLIDPRNWTFIDRFTCPLKS